MDMSRRCIDGIIISTVTSRSTGGSLDTLFESTPNASTLKFVGHNLLPNCRTALISWLKAGGRNLVTASRYNIYR